MKKARKKVRSVLIIVLDFQAAKMKNKKDFFYYLNGKIYLAAKDAN